jgi:hypothetical protein
MVVCITMEKRVPVTAGAVYLFKPIHGAWLDFELPED